MPCVLVACRLGLDARVAVVYCQVQGIDIGAGGTRLAVVIGVHTRGGVGLSVPVVLVTGSHMIGSGIMGADVEMQGVGTGTAVSVDIVIGIDSAFGVLSPVPRV